MFSKITGNNPIQESFKRLLRKQRVPRSLLFVGEDGIGKRLLALEIARAMVCRNPQDGEACDVCPACLRVDKFSFPKSDDRDGHKKVIFSEHPDIGLVIPYTKNIFVDAIREVETEANFRPYEANARFFIIDDADKMNDAAANALLKTLEEPPAASHLFLITSRPAALLATIRSRCQIIRLAPIETREIENHLTRTQKHSPDDATLLSRLAAGSIGRALAMNADKHREQRDMMLKVLESLAVKNIASLLQIAETLNDAKNKDSYESFLKILQSLIRDAWLLKLGEGDEKIANVDIRPRLEKLAATLNSKTMAAWQTDIETLRENLNVNLNKKIATDSLFMQMANG